MGSRITMKHYNDCTKGNIIRATILSQNFKRCGENNYTIKCTIRFYNPFIKSTQRVVGISKCHPEDVLSIKKGQHISESRAKVAMYKIIQQSIVDVLSETQDKYFILEKKEIAHINNLIND